MIIDHFYSPCKYDNSPVKYLRGFCLNPDGPDRCHRKGCGRPELEHKYGRQEIRNNQETDKTSE